MKLLFITCILLGLNSCMPFNNHPKTALQQQTILKSCQDSAVMITDLKNQTARQYYESSTGEKCRG